MTSAPATAERRLPWPWERTATVTTVRVQPPRSPTPAKMGNQGAGEGGGK